jgi:hypothetical protein
MRRFFTLCAIAGCLFAGGLAAAPTAGAIDRYEAASRFDALSRSDCGNGTTWVCFVRWPSTCAWLSHNYFWCERSWTETQYGVRNQNQRATGHLTPYLPVAGAWYSPDYRVTNF